MRLIDDPSVNASLLIELAAENAELRAALALAEGAGVHRELVSQELKHRIAKLLTVVMAISRKTVREGDAACKQDFNARLGALGAA